MPHIWSLPMVPAHTTRSMDTSPSCARLGNIVDRRPGQRLQSFAHKVRISRQGGEARNTPYGGQEMQGPVQAALTHCETLDVPSFLHAWALL